MVGWSIAVIYSASSAICCAILFWCRRDFIRRQTHVSELTEPHVLPAQLATTL
jgi:hypothetical protein